MGILYVYLMYPQGKSINHKIYLLFQSRVPAALKAWYMKGPPSLIILKSFTETLEIFLG